MHPIPLILSVVGEEELCLRLTDLVYFQLEISFRKISFSPFTFLSAKIFTNETTHIKRVSLVFNCINLVNIIKRYKPTLQHFTLLHKSRGKALKNF